MLLRLMALFSAIVHMGSAEGSGVVRRQAESEESVIVTSKTRAFLSCESGDMVVKMNFSLPFRGLIYAHKSRNSPCKVHGSGAYYYELRIPLKGCGTWQESPRVFTNNITIRFHPALELEEDETKTVVCRYPPPLTPPPGGISIVNPVTSSPSPAPTRVGTASLSEVEILIIICLLLFLSLVTLGIGIAYFCLKRRRIQLVRKALTGSSAPGSQLTGLTGPSLLGSVLGHTVRIPRAVPYSAPSLRTSELQSRGVDGASGESSEASSSSLDSGDASRNLLFRKTETRSLLSIPKAILRKSLYGRPSAAQTEDQTAVAVLEPENGTDGEEAAYYDIDGEVRTAPMENLVGVSPIPVYAQVDKSKKDRQRTKSPLHWSLRAVPGTAHQVITEVPEEATTTEEVTTNTTVTTSFRKEITERRLAAQPEGSTDASKTVPPSEGAPVAPKSILIQDVADVFVTTTVETELRESKTKVTRDKSEQRHNNVAGEHSSLAMSPHKHPSNVRAETSPLATSQTPSRNDDVGFRVSNATYQKHPSSVSRGLVSLETSQKHGKAEPVSPSMPLKHPGSFARESSFRNMLEQRHSDVVDRPMSPETSQLGPSNVHAEAASRKLLSNVTKDTVSREMSELHRIDVGARPVPSNLEAWNVVIRERKGTSTSEETRYHQADRGDDVKPHFDVTIRSIHPDDIKPKKLDTMMSIPPLEMPLSVGQLRAALGSQGAAPPKTKGHHQRSVRWLDSAKECKTIPEESSLSSSDSFRSEESLRERSSSEVLEVVPTLPGHQRKNSDHPMLERSTSELFPQDHLRWIGGAVPVLEHLAPEFLAKAPTVVSGGFFCKPTKLGET